MRLQITYEMRYKNTIFYKLYVIHKITFLNIYHFSSTYLVYKTNHIQVSTQNMICDVTIWIYRVARYVFNRISFSRNILRLPCKAKNTQCTSETFCLFSPQNKILIVVVSRYNARYFQFFSGLTITLTLLLSCNF